MATVTERTDKQVSTGQVSSKELSFCVIIPARNASHTLAETLDAVFRSTLQPHKTIVVNDGSQDDTAALAMAFPCEVIHVNLGQGPMQARFAGADLADQDILIFVDADVRVKPGTFKRILQDFNDPEIDAVTGLLAASPKLEHDNFFTAFKNEYMNYVFQKQSSRSRFLYGSICAIRRERLIRFIPIASPFGSLVSDSELGFRLRANGRRILLDHQLEVEHLKRYSLASLLANDFAIPFLFSMMLWRYGWSPATAKSGRFSHASLGQAAANALSFAALYSWCALAAGKSWAAVAIVAPLGVFGYWFIFLIRVLRNRGKNFFLKTLFFLPLDGAVMFCGMMAGLVCGAIQSIEARWSRFLYVRKLKHSNI
ncbi:MAG: hypothetical protein A2Y02_00880 [Omnitrophica bacterium GWA2_52_12]|nr:MAG: hypothetical protein A2Y02_00880 [Omnitrophica bacterium GWA2_52_12]